MHCSRTCTKWVYIWHILAFKAQTSLSMRAVSPELSLPSHMHNMGVHMAYFISECSDAPELTRAFTALAHAHRWAYIWHILSANAQTRSSMHAVLSEPSLLSQMQKNGRTYGIFYQSILRRACAYVQSHQSLHCSRTCTKWAYIWHILSVTSQTSLSMLVVSPEHSLLSNLHKTGVYMAYSIRQCLDKP